jgi:hypothetical protein
MAIVCRIIEHMKHKIRILEIQIQKQNNASIENSCKDSKSSQCNETIITEIYTKQNIPQQCNETIIPIPIPIVPIVPITCTTELQCNQPTESIELMKISNTILVDKLVVLHNSNNTSTSRCTLLEEKCRKLQETIDNQAITLCNSKQSTKEYRDLNSIYRKDLQDKDLYIQTLNKQIKSTTL